MCQLNLYIVSKSVDKEKVLKLLKEYFYYDKPECVTEENLLYEVQYDNNIYISAGMGCNCGTVQASFQEEDKTMSWEQLKESKIQAEKERIAKIKALVEREDFLEQRNNFYQKLDELNNIHSQEKGKESEELLLEIQKLIKDHSVLLEANYKIQKTEDGREYAICDLSENLEDIERNVCGNTETEFKNLKAFVDEILKECDEMKLLSFWQDGDMPKVETEEYVFQDELKIENIIYMKYNELLTIFKK